MRNLTPSMLKKIPDPATQEWHAARANSEGWSRHTLDTCLPDIKEIETVSKRIGAAV